MRHTMLTTLLLVVLPFSGRLEAQPDTTDTRLLHRPAISKDHIAFVYAGDLWICDLEGGNVRRLTSDVRSETNPEFSPDGQSIAYTGQYQVPSPGSGLTGFNVYTIAVAGGEPRRLTWAPGADTVRGWTPDGRSVLFSSWRQSRSWSYPELFTAPSDGDFPARLPLPHGHEASYSPDGTRLAYTPAWDPTWTRKNYRGGTHSRIWIVSLKDLAVEELPQPAGRCNDLSPRWLGDTVYFRSDRRGEFNLFAYDTKTKSVRQLTHFEDFPALGLNAGGGNVVFEQAGYLHRFDVATGQSRRLKIGVATELPLAYKSRLLLRPAHARDRLAGHEAQVRGIPAARDLVRRLTARHRLDAQ